MATDATGAATSPDSIPTYNTATDAPSGKGLNNIVAAIQTALSARITKALTTTIGDIIYASAPSTPARLGIGSTGNVLTVAGGVPTWATPANSGAMLQIFDTVIGANTTTIDITAIAATYNHLRLVGQFRTDRAALTDAVRIRFNNDSGANYYGQVIEASTVFAVNGAGAAATSIYSGICAGGATGAANGFGEVEWSIPHYANAITHKAIGLHSSYMDNATASMMSITGGGRWASTAAISRITLTPFSGTNFVAGSRISLYGIT